MEFLCESTYFTMISEVFCILYDSRTPMLFGWTRFTVFSRAPLEIYTLHCVFRRLFVLQVIDVYAFGFYMIYCDFQGLSWNQYISLFWGNGLFCFMSRWHTRLWIEHDLLWFPGPNLKSTHSTINQIQLTVINLARYETTNHEMKISCNFRGKMLSFL